MLATARFASSAFCTNGKSRLCAPASSARLTITMSFHGGRTIACAGVPAIVCRMPIICGVSIGVCSMSTTRKSKPMQPSASAVDGAELTSQAPTGVLPDAIARLK